MKVIGDTTRFAVGEIGSETSAMPTFGIQVLVGSQVTATVLHVTDAESGVVDTATTVVDVGVVVSNPSQTTRTSAQLAPSTWLTYEITDDPSSDWRPKICVTSRLLIVAGPHEGVGCRVT